MFLTGSDLDFAKYQHFLTNGSTCVLENGDTTSVAWDRTTGFRILRENTTHTVLHHFQVEGGDVDVRLIDCKIEERDEPVAEVRGLDLEYSFDDAWNEFVYCGTIYGRRDFEEDVTSPISYELKFWDKATPGNDLRYGYDDAAQTENATWIISLNDENGFRTLIGAASGEVVCMPLTTGALEFVPCDLVM